LSRKTSVGFRKLKEKPVQTLYHIFLKLTLFPLDIFLCFAILTSVMTALITYLPYIQIVLAILLIASVLIQQSEASSGGAFGGADNWNAGYHTRRGFEKVIFNMTIILGILFTIFSFITLIIK